MSDDTSIPRFHWLHRWSKWSEPETVKYVRPLMTVASSCYTSFSSEGIEVERIEQRRHCVICHAEEMRHV